MTHTPNTAFGRVLREELDANADEAAGYRDGKSGAMPRQPDNARYMRAWSEGRHDAEAAARAGK